MSALLALLLQAPPPNWERLGPSPGGVTYHDPSGTIIIDAAKRRVRLRNVYDEAGRTPAASIALVEVDCVNRTVRLLEMQQLDAAGTVIETRTMPPGQGHSAPAPRGGPEEAQLMRICRTPE